MPPIQLHPSRRRSRARSLSFCKPADEQETMSPTTSTMMMMAAALLSRMGHSALLGTTGAASTSCAMDCASNVQCQSFTYSSTGMGHACNLYSTPGEGQTSIVGSAGATADCAVACRNTPSCTAVFVKSTGMSHACILLSNCLDPSVGCLTPAPTSVPVLLGTTGAAETPSCAVACVKNVQCKSFTYSSTGMGHSCSLYSTPDAGQTSIVGGVGAGYDCSAACQNSPTCQAIVVTSTGMGHGCNFLSNCLDPSISCMKTAAPSAPAPSPTPVPVATHPTQAPDLIAQTGAGTSCAASCANTAGCKAFTMTTTGMGHACNLYRSCDPTRTCIVAQTTLTDCKSSCASTSGCKAWVDMLPAMAHTCVLLSDCHNDANLVCAADTSSSSSVSSVSTLWMVTAFVLTVGGLFLIR